MLTLNDGQKNDNDKEEKCDIEDDTIEFVLVTVWRLDFITDTTTGSYTFV